MNREEKKHKLANAIREFRGAYNVSTKKWIRPPNPAKEERCIHWLTKLQIDVKPALQTIKAFRTLAEFHEWLKQLDKSPDEI